MSIADRIVFATKWLPMNPQLFLANAVGPALKLLPSAMDVVPARAMLLAITLQESRLTFRRQINGPARGYYQFEQAGGIRGVLNNQSTRPLIQVVLSALDYGPDGQEYICWTAVEHNDILATVFARLLLWTSSRSLPLSTDPQAGWDYYVGCWRPGQPRRETWDDFYNRAWSEVT